MGLEYCYRCGDWHDIDDDCDAVNHSESSLNALLGEINFIMENLPSNRPLYNDSGLWSISDDYGNELYTQETNETFTQFVRRAFCDENVFD